MMVENQCPKCGTACSPTARFCIRCRTPLSSNAQKKLTCSKGHRQDPSWKECPFCQGSDNTNPIYMAEANQNQSVRDVFASTPQQGGVSRSRTVVESPNSPVSAEPAPKSASPNQPQRRPAPQLPPVNSPADPYKTVIADSADPNRPVTPRNPQRPVKNLDRGKTQVMNPKAQATKAPVGKIIGVLASFSHNENGHAFLIRTGRNVIGTNRQASIRVNDPNISDKHAIIMGNPAKCVIDDCLSTNGTFVNGTAIQEKVELQPGDVIQTGDTLWRFVRIHPPDPSEKVDPS